MNRSLILIIGLVLLAALLYHCLNTRPPAIQSDVLACVSQRIDSSGLAGVDVTVDGRDVTLAGTLVSEAQRQQAENAALDNCGARVVDNLTEVASLPPYETVMCVDAEGARIRGDVASDDVRESTLTTASRRFHGNADSNVTVRRDLPPGHSQILPAALYELTQLDEGCITIRETTVSVAGVIRSEEARDRLISLLDGAAGSNFATSYDLRVPEMSEHALLCQALFDEMTAEGEEVFFEFDSAEIHRQGRELLDSIVDRAAACSTLRITVTGHTDSVGDAGYNRELSLRRAQAVVDYLVAKNVDGTHLTAVGYGETQPKASNKTEEGRAQNRRIEFRVREIQ